jgi:hypothetical protein
MAQHRRGAAFALAVACGVGIWLLSPLITGKGEPWDAAGGYYPGALCLSGLTVGFSFPAHPGVVALGIVIGQVLVLLGWVAGDATGGGLWVLGLVFLAGYGVVALVGAVLGATVRRLWAGHRPDEG